MCGRFRYLIVVVIFSFLKTSSACPEKCNCDPDGFIVNCANSGFKSIPGGIGSQATNLNLSGNSITKIGDDDLSQFAFLQTLDLKYNELRILNSKSLYSLKVLRYLYISNNQLHQLPGNLFKYQESLVTLDISRNRLTILEEDTFRNCDKLTNLFAQHNGFTKNIFYKLNLLSDLKILDLSYNPIKQLPYSMLSRSSIVDLKVNNAALFYIDGTAIKTMKSLEYLSLNNNQLIYLPRNLFNGLRALTKVSLKNNKFECNCDLHHVLVFFYEKDVELSGNSLLCSTMNGTKLLLKDIDEDSKTERFCNPDWSTKKIISTTTTTPRPTTLRMERITQSVGLSNTAYCSRLARKLDITPINITKHSITLIWSLPYSNYKDALQISIVDEDNTIVDSKLVKVSSMKTKLGNLKTNRDYMIRVKIPECSHVLMITVQTEASQHSANPIGVKQPIMNWTYIYIGSIIGALGLLLAITCAVACYLLSKRKHQRLDNKRRPMTVMTGSLERTSHLNGMSSLQRTGVCMLDGPSDNLYESISRHASISQKPSSSSSLRRNSSSGTMLVGVAAGPCSMASTRYAVQCDHVTMSPDHHRHHHHNNNNNNNPSGQGLHDSYAAMTVSRPSMLADDHEVDYLQPSPGPVPAPRVPAQYANSPLLERSRTSVHQYEPDTKPTTFR